MAKILPMLNIILIIFLSHFVFTQAYLTFLHNRISPTINNASLESESDESELDESALDESELEESDESVEVNIGNCLTFSNDEKFPWWRVDLEKTYYVFKIRVNDVILKKNQEITFVKVQIRVGFEDIATVSNNEEALKFNHLCREVHYWHTAYNTIYCQEHLYGQFVSLHMMNTRNLEDKLLLCGFEVWGKELEEVPAKRFIPLVKQSSSLDSRLTIDKNFNTQFEETKKIFQCLQFNISNSTKSGDLFWEVNLRQQYTVEKVVLHTLNATETTYEIFRIQVLVHNISRTKGFTIPQTVFNISCTKNQASVKDRSEFQCHDSVKGQFVSIYFYPKCGDDPECKIRNDSLNLCEVEVWGYANDNILVDIAENKPTNQSTSVHGGESHLAVDGKYSSTFYNGNTAACTHSSGYDSQDAFPWWRVDLLGKHYVQGLIIQNRGETLHSRLHDIVIRIGNKDIVDIYGSKVIFGENYICKSFINQYLSPWKNNITCDIPLIGRFVSIQIVKHCDIISCHSRSHNFLTLCEVDILGYPIKKKKTVNLVVDKPILVSEAVKEMKETMRKTHEKNNDIFNIPGVKEMEEALIYPWWRVDLRDIFVVEDVLLQFQPLNSRIPSQEIMIRVGSKDIKNHKKGKYFNENTLCAQEEVTIEEIGEKIFSCEQPVIGRFISIQVIEMCNYIYCSVTILPIINIEVLGYKLEKLQNVTNIALGKRAETNDNKFSYLANNGQVPSKLFTLQKNLMCSKSAPGDEYPWWSAKFATSILVHSVNIYNVEGNQSKLMHDIEVRVGYGEIITNHSVPIFRKNELCLGKYNQSLPEGLNVFTCFRPVFGKFISIQIVNKCSEETCGFDFPNTLILCEVEILTYNMKPPYIGKNVSLNKQFARSNNTIDDLDLDTTHE